VNKRETAMTLNVQPCPECHTRVVPMSDGTCPACRKRVFFTRDDGDSALAGDRGALHVGAQKGQQKVSSQSGLASTPKYTLGTKDQQGF